ncbi:HelD family protein [Streptomyces sp. ME19-01-6]|uniref:HelD family protein n=1 Tax=Streptomyces sp. ME19-01-6 TaxID=3028686 RepID=UPI0029B363CC|nr:ATP-binding domain-containing protein [Streptomyces sp. ME19-01-6]MDX3233714.1 ATP-binding domain-containing protein [Streptomyces sp. ME19-01-6]
MSHSDSVLSDALTRERAYHDACRAALKAMVDGAQEQVVVGEDASASGADAEVLGYLLRSQAKELRELPEGPLFFGRIDFARDTQAAGDHAGQEYHIGRVRVAHDPSAPPLVVDWRAPVARAFYQASALNPQGVAVRRRFGWSPASRGDWADLTGLEDEHLSEGEARESSIVASEIERPRIGPMRDIAATIQPEQDDLVREGLTTSLCVQGAPGTGKTAVGLHRAAYLLYTYPQRIQRGGMLILGPNRAFLAYISEVLPVLGETGVRQSTLDDEIARHPVTAQDSDTAAIVKHDIRMAEVLRRAIYARVGAEATSLVLPDGSYRWRVPADALEKIVRDVRTEEPPYAVGRQRVRTRIVRAVQHQAERRGGPRTNTWVQKISRARPVTTLLNTLWPAVQPEEILTDLFTHPDTLAAAAEGVLDLDEQKALLWPKPPRSARSARWSAADLVLLDELAGLIERSDGYGHVVIDEAQDLSPMQCRAIARRSPFGSVTVLGDLAQGTTPWAARDWPQFLTHLGKPDAIVTPLTTGFRVPGAVTELANRLLRHLAADVPPARSLRRDGEVSIDVTHDTTAATVAAVNTALEHAGSIGVIAADAEAPKLHRALIEAGIPASGPDTLRARLTVVPASTAKGLEYDHVVVVEPSAIVQAEPRGMNRLYVALTRAVSRLHIVHSAPLPLAIRPLESQHIKPPTS